MRRVVFASMLSSLVCAVTSTAVAAPVATFTTVPDPTCTGVPTTLDASGSTGVDAPITTYRFTYLERGVDAGSRVAPVQRVIADGPDPVAHVVFDWNRVSAGPRGGKVFAVRDPVPVTLTVTDADGGQAVETETVRIAQPRTADARTACPPAADPDLAFAPPELGDALPVDALSSPVVLPMHCPGGVACVGRLTLSAEPRATRAAAHPRKSRIVASAVFKVEPGESGGVAARLTKMGRRLLRSRDSVETTATIESALPSGAFTTSSATLTLTRVPG